MADAIENYKSQIVLARTEMKNLRQQLIALKYGHQKEIKLIKTVLNDLRCASCGDAATTVGCHRTNKPSTSIIDCDAISYRPIGVIETAFQNKRGVPRQPTVMANSRGAVIIDTAVFNNPEHAMSGLEEFSHMWIIFHFHETDSTSVPAKVAPPRLGGERRGVFSTRSPHRPCPIGLSLVKIHSIEDNKIHFLGVDMVNGTPVLDVKPYIPQYDYPISFSDGSVRQTLVRPPTEGISDVAETITDLSIADTYDPSSASPGLTNSTAETGSPRSQSPFEDLPSEIRQSKLVAPTSLLPDSPSSVDRVDGNLRARSPVRRHNMERGAPDGQERFTPPQSAHFTNMRHDGIRVAPWISNPPSQTYEVRFTTDALEKLNELIGERADAFKSNIESLLSEDPRSNYVRNRYPDHEYSCVLEDLSISCIFDSNSCVCTIIAVRNAEELQRT